MALPKTKLRVIPLGGLGEIGKNMTALEYGQDILLIDCGSSFPNESMLGIDLVIPDIEYLVDNRERIRGIVLTHGHEDHIGALPYVLREIHAPLYASRLTLALVENKLNEHSIKADMRCVEPGENVRLGCFKVDFIKTTHSIAGAFALGIHTPVGVVVHTGDFKVDHTPIDGTAIDLCRLAALGEKGVLLLMSDSTNAERPGYTMSERLVGQSFDRYFKEAKGRIIIASFASNIHRVQQVIDTAQLYNRKVCFQGRSMINISKVAIELGYLKIDERQIIEVERIHQCKDNEVVILTTGSQGEPMSGLVRMANGAHRVEIRRGDMVIISANPIPGNEKLVSNVIDQLYLRGARVIYESLADVHVSGHACQEELKLMLTLTRPRNFLPVHGEYRMLYKHAELANTLGVRRQNTFIMNIGDVLELTGRSAQLVGSVPAGSVMVDGSGIGDVGNIVLRDRRILAQEGLFLVVLSLDKKSGKLIGDPDIISRGFVYMREAEQLIEDARLLVRDTVEHMPPRSDWSSIKSAVRNVLREALYARTKRHPMILTVVVEV